MPLNGVLLEPTLKLMSRTGGAANFDIEDRPTTEDAQVLFKATYPFVLPAEVPADRVDALRLAFEETMRDPRFLEDARKSSMPIKPLRGAEIERLVRETYAVPERTLERLRAAVQP